MPRNARSRARSIAPKVRVIAKVKVKNGTATKKTGMRAIEVTVNARVSEKNSEPSTRPTARCITRSQVRASV